MSHGRLSGRVALITGAARGQGAAQATLFVAEGAKVMITDLPSPAGEALAQTLGPNALWRALDVTDHEAWDAAVGATIEAFGRLDILVNNAGIALPGTIEDMSIADYRKVIDTNQFGCWLGMKAVIPAMRAAGGGSIINTSSTAGLVGCKGMSAYSASKHAVVGMTRTAAAELGAYGIRVNCVHPGAVRAPMLRGGAETSDDMLAHQAIPRLGRPDEVARMMLFLASDEASYCTGSQFLIDGGFLAAPSLLARVPEQI